MSNEPIPVFWMEQTDRSRRFLRRFASNKPCPNYPGTYSYHNVKVQIEDGHAHDTIGDLHSHDDPRWPKTCTCGYEFLDTDQWQLFNQTLYIRPDTKEEYTLESAPVGAMYDSSWLASRRTYPGFDIGEDGISLTVKTPGGIWQVDSRADNCTLPNDNTHKCWARHGNVKEMPSKVHVDKNGHTCSAGAGSIQTKTWHGYLDQGMLRLNRNSM